jgi:hypothetical protein
MNNTYCKLLEANKKPIYPIQDINMLLLPQLDGFYNAKSMASTNTIPTLPPSTQRTLPIPKGASNVAPIPSGIFNVSAIIRNYQ